MTITVLLADDQAMVRAGFRLILDSEADITVVGEANDGEHAVDLTRRLHPDLVLMDIQMPRVDGVVATRRLPQEPGASRIVILTTFERDDYVFQALRAGASGFLLKNAPPEELVHAATCLGRSRRRRRRLGPDLEGRVWSAGARRGS